MITRVTDGQVSRSSLVGIQSASSRLAVAQAKMSGGKQITKPSDNPGGTVKALQLRQTLARLDQYTANQNFGLGWLSTADSALSGATSQLQSARVLVLQGLNSGTQDQSSLNAIAAQVDAIRSSLITTANTTFNGRPVFAGTSSSPAAYDSSGNYLGDNGTVSQTVAQNSSVQINQTGTQVFGAPGNDVFSTLSAVSAALRSGNTPALSSQLAALDTAISTVTAAQASEGAAYNRIQQVQTAQSTTSTALKAQLSDIQDIDLAEMAIQVTTANTNYQAALQTTASIRQLSLMDFLR